MSADPRVTFNPGALWSVWDMLKITAEKFVVSMEYFGRIGRLYSNHADESEICEAHVKKYMRRSISDVEEFIGGFRAPATSSAIRYLSLGLRDKPCFLREMGLRSEQVFDRFQSEVGDQWLIIVNHEHSEYLNDEAAPFGEDVRSAFPQLMEDIDEAAKCLALSRYTACVFHLMRVMERTVHILSKNLKVSIDLRTATWNDITTGIGNKVNAMPGKTAHNKKKKQMYGEILTNLNSVRIAWRNEVMHPKKTYTQKEAAKVFNHVEGFLTSILPLA